MRQMANGPRWVLGAVLACLAGAGLVSACNSHPVNMNEAEGTVSVHEDRTPGSAAAVDVLWMIDNSGSMCEEQESLRDNFREFIRDFSERNIDFQIGVTTSQMVDDDTYPNEVVARPAHIQAVPQPVPSYIDTCHGDPGSGDAATDGYQPIRDALEVAVDTCTKDPEEWQHLKDVTNGEIECHLAQECGEPHELFPTYEAENDEGEMVQMQPGWDTDPEQSPYREIPLVLRAEDYRDGDTLDQEQLERDFSCMSLVGTNGYAIEEGLKAAVEAVSPDMTGGPVENPTDENAPNHGLIRENANFSLIFVTDENDCSDDGTLDLRTDCGSSICDFANHPDVEDSPLLSTDGLANQFLDNLAQSKHGEGASREDLSTGDIVVASIHGSWQRYGEDPNNPPSDALTFEECQDLDRQPTENEVDQPACESEEFGTAYSGDRYERFLRNFDRDRVFPEVPEDEGEHLDGLICLPSRIPGTLSGIAEMITESISHCIDEVPYPCDTSEDCPGYVHSQEGDSPSCEEFGQSGENYCDSAVQLRMFPDENSDVTIEDLREHDYCLENETEQDERIAPGGCVIKRDKYRLSNCPGKDDAVELTWTEADYFDDLDGYTVDMVYAKVRGDDTDEDDSGDDAEE